MRFSFVTEAELDKPRPRLYLLDGQSAPSAECGSEQFPVMMPAAQFRTCTRILVQARSSSNCYRKELFVFHSFTGLQFAVT